MKEERKKGSFIIWAICAYLVGSATYSLASMSNSFDHAPMFWILFAIGYQTLKIIAGVALYFKKAYTPYLALVILAWTLIATVNGIYSQSEASLNRYSVAYIIVSLAILVAFVIYCFWLKKQGYYVERKHA